MVDNAFGGFFVSDVDDVMLEEDDGLITVPVTVPASEPESVAATPPNGAIETSVPAGQAVAAQPPAVTGTPSTAVPAPVLPAPGAASGRLSREERLAVALNRLMEESSEVQASVLVSLDGFAMASALPEGMQEDRVGAMSAAILGLGERAAVELGKGPLSQVFIEGEDGYVILISAGPRAALTCLADKDAKLGLVLYDMRTTADEIAEILG